MSASTASLTLAPDAAIDLQLHTTYSDGVWDPARLLEHLAGEQFALAAITDHDRPDTAAALQQLARAADLPLLPAVEMTCSWRGEMVDVLCFGLRPGQRVLTDVADELVRRQQENTREVYEKLRRAGHLADHPAELRALLDAPSAQQPHALVDLVRRSGRDTDEATLRGRVRDAGCAFATSDIATVVDAAHQSGAVCLIAHPGRDDGFVRFDAALLDELRQEIPIDGLEAYYPAHTPQQVALYQEYARRHRLLVSAGSDSHGPQRQPIKYRAGLCRDLLERVGVRVT